MLAVIAIPEFDPAAAAWIAAIRRAHDPLQDRVGPHVTLMFPAAVADEAALQVRAAQLAAGSAAFQVGFDRLARMEDPHKPKYRFLNVLMADAETAARLEPLHLALSGPGGVYAPHLTISRFGAVYSAKALERQIGALSAPVIGRLAALALLRIENGAIRCEATFALGG